METVSVKKIIIIGFHINIFCNFTVKYGIELYQYQHLRKSYMFLESFLLLMYAFQHYNDVELKKKMTFYHETYKSGCTDFSLLIHVKKNFTNCNRHFRYLQSGRNSRNCITKPINIVLGY